MSKSKTKFKVSSLLAAGLASTGVTVADEAPNSTVIDGVDFQGLQDIVDDISKAPTYTLAAHRSHQSHSSHYSHQSHRSSSLRMPTVGQSNPDEAIETRNEQSTPRSTILPSSPAIVKRVKVLPGNSAKFHDAVRRVQIALSVKGYQVGSIDGELHARTVAALYQYQKDLGMVPSGKLTNEVLYSLGIQVK